eukprot:7286044-Alexandrium_andersonii.AAC.1
MSASLVGSEMCIRDSSTSNPGDSRQSGVRLVCPGASAGDGPARLVHTRPHTRAQANPGAPDLPDWRRPEGGP